MFVRGLFPNASGEAPGTLLTPFVTLAVSGHKNFLLLPSLASSLNSLNTPWLWARLSPWWHILWIRPPNYCLPKKQLLGNSQNLWCQLGISSHNRISRFGFPFFFKYIYIFFSTSYNVHPETVIHRKYLPECACPLVVGRVKDSLKDTAYTTEPQTTNGDDGLKLTNQNSLYWRNRRNWYIWN